MEKSGEQQRLEQEVRRLERELRRLRQRADSVDADGAPLAAAHDFGNIEGLDEFTPRWVWDTGEATRPGLTAVLRVKNESASLPWVLPPLLRAVERVIVVDNDSTDGTPDTARRVAAEADAADRLAVHIYPFSVSRCGPEHLATSPQSVHSLTYFYNYSFALVRTGYALKWDGDMVLTEDGIAALQDLSWQLEGVQRIITMRRYPLYVADDRTGFLDVSVVNRESWGWPNIEGFTHGKAFEWELPNWPTGLPTVSLPDWSCIELKHLDVDEFAHWSHEDFESTGRTTRKKREWDVFHSLATGAEPPYGVLRIEAPEGRHIIDYVRSDYVPERRDWLTSLHRKVLVRMAVRRD